MTAHKATMPRGEWWIPSAEETALLTVARLDLRLLTWVVVQDLVAHYDLDALPACDVATKGEVELAALAVYRAVHAYLEPREGCTLPPRLVGMVSDPPNTARLAVEQVSKRKRAKELQLEASGDRPLTVCLGRRLRRLPELRQHVPAFIEKYEDGVEPSTTDVIDGPDGCMRVVADSPSLRPPAFARYCPDCQDRSSEIRRKRLRRIKLSWSGTFLTNMRTLDGKPIYRRPACSGCGDPFDTPNSRETRCRACIDGHRGPTRTAARSRTFLR
jgi:hypothetical protein